ncbi:lipocalin family protein [Ornithinimicrobium sp. Arc0846-15]|nr:lipocalin family protein [Ornithinimicrobium laminariae]
MIRLEDDYSIALLGTPDRKSVWLLARQGRFCLNAGSEHVETAREHGFDVDRLLVADWDNRVTLEESRDND